MTLVADAHGFLRDFPAAVLLLSPDGVVLYSNGRLERELDRALTGAPFCAALDEPSCGRKWERLLADRARLPPEAVVELILRSGDTPLEPRGFSVIPASDGDALWLVERRHDPRHEAPHARVMEINSELVNAQRELAKERARLARALAALEQQYGEQERLSALLREQNARIEAQNDELVATARELQARRDELERSNRALDEFAYVVSHDLKAPLRGIANHASWIEEDVAAAALAPETRSHLDALRGQVARMRAMIDGILQYARAGREHDRPRRVDVGALLREILELLDPAPEVAVSVDGPMPTLETGRVPLQQVLQNLIDNAIKYAPRGTPAGGGRPRARVRVSARDAGEFYEFAVADDGPGIAPRLHARIWGLFDTLEPRDSADGTGIGLAVVRKLVEAQGGRAWVESEKGAGATFRFLWRKAPSASERASRAD